MNAEQRLSILSRGTEEILPEGALLERLQLCERQGRPLRVKQGFDPTAPDIHLGHTVGLRKLRQFQDLGHQVVLIIGDYTGMVGDPSGRSKTRPQLSEADVVQNAHSYLEQFYSVLEREPRAPKLPVEVHRNSEWFSRMRFLDVIKLASQYTVARMLERDDFAKRHAARQPISVHELLYPLMQGYDSVAIKADLELGATEQKFNLLVGRALQEIHGQLPQVVLTLPVLPGLDGVQRMAKSLGNYIGVTDPPAEMYGKVMSIPDSVLAIFWRLTADASESELAEVSRSLEDHSENPMIVKKRLAHRLVSMYNDAAAADQAQTYFETVYGRREIPDHMVDEFYQDEVRRVSKNAETPSIVDFICASGIASTRSAARRLIEQGAVKLDDNPVRGWDEGVDPTTSHVIRAGRKIKRYRPVPE